MKHEPSSKESPRVLTDAGFTAFSLANALSNRGFAPWPSADPPALDRAELARELRSLEGLDRGHELAVIALAELGDGGDPALRAELAAHAREGSGEGGASEAEDTVDALLRARALDGLSSEDGRRSLRIDWVRLHRDAGRDAVHFALSRTDGDGRVRVRGQTSAPSAIARALAPAPDWRARVVSSLAAALADPDGDPTTLLEQALQSLLPSAITGRAAWLLGRGVALFGGEAEPMVSWIEGDRSHLILWVDVLHEARAAVFGTLRATFRALSLEDGQVVDGHEREVFLPSLDPRSYREEGPPDESVALATVAAWREAAIGYLVAHAARWAEHADWMDEFMGASRPLALLETRIADGPPPVAGPTASPVRWTDAWLSDVAARSRWLGEDELARVRAEEDDQALAVLEVDGWRVLFCPFHRGAPGTFREDRIFVRPPGGASVAILLSDPWNGHVMPIDGDDALLRAVAGFWCALIDRMDADVSFAWSLSGEADDEDWDEGEGEGEGEDEDEGERGGREMTTLREWLAFRSPDATPGFPVIDPRVYGGEVDRVASFSFWQAGPFAMSPAVRARYATAVESHYRAFVRAVVDPTFTSR
jgi:hypothetical protein